MIFKFFEAQCKHPVRGDWVSGVKHILINSDINISFTDIKNMKKRQFMKIVHQKINKLAFTYLVSKIKSKGKEIYYGEYLSCQLYLQPNSVLTFEEQQNIFSYRTRMNNLEL